MALSSAEIARRIEELGASLSGFSGLNSLGLTGRCLAGDQERLVSLLQTCLTESAFPGDELEKERALQIGAIQRQQERPMFLAQDQLHGALFPHHPYRWIPLGLEKTVASLSRDDVRDHYRKLVNASNVVIAVFGDITKEEATALMEP